MPEDMLRDCQRIHLDEGHFGIFYFPEATIGVTNHIRPAKYIRDAVGEMLKTGFPDGIRVAVHNRIMKEGAPDENGILYLCRQSHWSVYSGKGWALREKIKKFSEEDLDRH
eukprot:UN32176